MIAVHVTHEAVEKMGGIGAVIAGLVTSADYRKVFGRTVLIGPLLTTDRPAAERFGPGGKILYSSIDGIDTADWARRFKPLEQTYQVGIVYGIRQLSDGGTADSAEVEVLLVDVFGCNKDRLNLFKTELFTRFSVASDAFEHIWEFEQYVRLAEPAYEAMHVIGCEGPPAEPPVASPVEPPVASPVEPVVLFAHEYMGLPTALKAVMDRRPDVRTVFYAHEAASVRRIVEKHPGHDIMFYNLLAAGEKADKGLEEFFPEVHNYFKHPLIKAAFHCDAVFAVGDLVGREMRFLDPARERSSVEMVYNGVPTGATAGGLAERQKHRGHMRQYAKNLFGFRPDYIFTHVARPVLSKGIWRDLRVLHELEGILAREGRTAAYFMLGTLAGQRRKRDVASMERDYGWPVHHRVGYPDLCNGEETLGELFEDFNRHHEAIRVVLVNQFGWTRSLCGQRMPAEMTLADIRAGTDVEFGLSVYEPFGISQLEPLACGAICALSSVCGCVGLLRRCCGPKLPANILVADFTHLRRPVKPEAAVQIGLAKRSAVEAAEGKRLARRLAERLPKNDAEIADLLETGAALGQKITWERTVREFFLPAVARVCE